MSRLRTLPVAAVAIALVGTAAVGARGLAGGDHHRAPPRAFVPLGGTDLPASPVPTLRVGRPHLLDRRDAALWAPVVRAVPATLHPGASEVVQVVGTRTPELTENLVLVLRERVVAGDTWSEVRLPSASGVRTGWVPRSALGALHIVDGRLRVDLARLRLTLFVGGRPAFEAPVGVGRPDTPTPTGQFYVRDKLTRYQSPFYGPIAFGTSARSSVLTDWPAGGYIGIHGTNEPELIPGRISHGCIRLRNDDLLKLSRLLPIGTPITIVGA